MPRASRRCSPSTSCRRHWTGTIDIWCPLTPIYNHDAAQQRRAHGERFWWYVCCGPHAPYCTLFIDHPATDLRVWLWQTWQRNIVGVLVWESTYWTSRADLRPEPLPGPDGLRERHRGREEKQVLGQRRRAVPLSAAGGRRAGHLRRPAR